MKLTVKQAVQALHANPEKTFITLLREGNMSVELFEPKGVDLQQPHEQDEIYVIIEGTGIFQDGPETYPFGPGDVIFVPAKREHRFLEFSEGFKTWVIFY